MMSPEWSPPHRGGSWRRCQSHPEAGHAANSEAPRWITPTPPTPRGTGNRSSITSGTWPDWLRSWPTEMS